MIYSTDQDVWDVKKFLEYCAESHPRAQLADYMKRLHQSEFGSDRAICGEESSLEEMKADLAGLTEKMKRRPWFEPFCGYFCRMNLSVSKILSPELMTRILIQSSREIPKTAWFRFEEKLRIFWETCRDTPERYRFTTSGKAHAGADERGGRQHGAGALPGGDLREGEERGALLLPALPLFRYEPG